MFNPLMGLYTVAWFKLHLHSPTPPTPLGEDWEALIFGGGKSSICGGGDGAMEACTMLRSEGSLSPTPLPPLEPSPSPEPEATPQLGADDLAVDSDSIL